VSAPPEALPAVTLIVPARNEEAHLADCLAAIAAQDYPAERLEVLVVDGGSQDGTLAAARRWTDSDPRFRLLGNPRGKVAAGLNVGIAAARGEILLRVDAHTLPAPDYVRRCVETLAATGADNAGGPMAPAGDTPVGRAVALAMGSRFGVGTARFRFARAVEEVDTVYLGAFPRRVLERVGPFNEELDRNQDYEMNYRIRRSGGRIVVDPRIRSVYRTRRTLAEVREQYAGYGFWKAQMLRRHPASLRPRQLAAPALVVGLLLAGAASLAALLLPQLPRALALALPALAGAYLAAALAVSVRLSIAGRDLRLLPPLLAVLPTLHLAWGCGFLAGLRTRRRGSSAG
jgi:succinoglycan biosynthesis protein ExoA